MNPRVRETGLGASHRFIVSTTVQLRSSKLVAAQAAATAALEDGHDDEVTTSGDGGTNAAVGDDTLETERSDSQPSQAGPYLTGSAQKY